VRSAKRVPAALERRVFADARVTCTASPPDPQVIVAHSWVSRRACGCGSRTASPPPRIRRVDPCCVLCVHLCRHAIATESCHLPKTPSPGLTLGGGPWTGVSHFHVTRTQETTANCYLLPMPRRNPSARNPGALSDGARPSPAASRKRVAKPSSRSGKTVDGKDTASAPLRFAAIDFETADYGRDSACAVAIVVVDGERIAKTLTHLIRPPRREFVFSYIHGISWADVREEPTFRELWPDILPHLKDVDFLAAHNASFDRSVLHACCEASRVDPVAHGFVCTVKLARAIWNLRPTTLPDVCRHLKIPLTHHDAASDALACSKIIMAARRKGFDLGTMIDRKKVTTGN
jgi:DNA polymerase III subunit epsilon